MTDYYPWYILLCRVVQLSSPKLNYLIIAGALILYITLFLVVYPNHASNLLVDEVLCDVSNTTTMLYYMLFTEWSFPCMQITYASGIGVSLCVGTIQGKMFRIFHIFHNPSPAKKVVTHALHEIK